MKDIFTKVTSKFAPNKINRLKMANGSHNKLQSNPFIRAPTFSLFSFLKKRVKANLFFLNSYLKSLLKLYNSKSSI